jgi:hypothetical protein
MTRHEWDEASDRDLDERLTALFRSIGSPEAAPDFTARTMRAVRRAPLPPGRRALAHPLLVPIGWFALVSGVAAGGVGLAMLEPAVPRALAWFVTRGIGASVWLLRSLIAWSTLFDLFAVSSDAVARAVVSVEGSLTLALVALVAAASLATLNRLIGIQPAPRLEPRN